MKKLFFVCLMAASQSLFAQNIELPEIESLLSISSMDSIDNFLVAKGFQKVKIQAGAPVMGLQLKEGWSYRPDPIPEARSVTILARYIDTSGRSFYRLQTTNAFFYSHLMNQLPENNYSYRGTIPKEKEANLLFSNNKNEIIIRIGSEFQVPYHYQINIGESVSDIGYFMPRKAHVQRVTVKPRKKKV